jgi:hypothetical protein
VRWRLVEAAARELSLTGGKGIPAIPKRADISSGRLFAGCEMKGGFTSEYATFYDRYSKSDGAGSKIKELFGVDVNEVK